MGSPRKKPIREKKPPPPPTPKSQQPWDPLPLPDNGDKNDSLTFEFVGRATSSWEYFEGYLGLVFSAIVDAESTSGSAMRAYGSVLSFSGRLAMVRAASEPLFLMFPNFDIEKRFENLTTAAQGFSTRRNEIAHGIVQPYFVGSEDRGFAVVPSYFATNKRSVLVGDTDLDPLKNTAAYAYTSKELAHWMKQFQTLANDALSLYRHLAAASAAAKKRRKAIMLGRALQAIGRSSAESTEPSQKGPKE